MSINAATRADRIAQTPKGERLTARQWRLILEIYDHRCAYCGAYGVPLQKDHRQPLSRDGTHTAANILPACRACNGHKHDLSEEQFRAWLSWPEEWQLSCGHTVPRRRPVHVLPYGWCAACGEGLLPPPRTDDLLRVWRCSRNRWLDVSSSPRREGDVRIAFDTREGENGEDAKPCVVILRRVVEPEIRPIVALVPWLEGKGRWCFVLLHGAALDGCDLFPTFPGSRCATFRTPRELRHVSRSWLTAMADLAGIEADSPLRSRLLSVAHARAYLEEWG